MKHWHVYGVDLSNTRYEGLRDGLETNLLTGQTSQTILGENLPVRDFPNTDADSFALFWQDEIRLGEHFAVVPGVRIGELCHLRNPDHSLSLMAEVIGFQQHQALLTPLGEMHGISSNTEVSPTGTMHQVGVGEHLLGQVLDGLGQPLQGAPLGEPAAWYPVYRDAPAPMSRQLITRPISLGVRTLDGLLCCGEGQRMGIFVLSSFKFVFGFTGNSGYVFRR